MASRIGAHAWDVSCSQLNSRAAERALQVEATFNDLLQLRALIGSAWDMGLE